MLEPPTQTLATHALHSVKLSNKRAKVECATLAARWGAVDMKGLVIRPSRQTMQSPSAVTGDNAHRLASVLLAVPEVGTRPSSIVNGFSLTGLR